MNARVRLPEPPKLDLAPTEYLAAQWAWFSCDRHDRLAWFVSLSFPAREPIMLCGYRYEELLTMTWVELPDQVTTTLALDMRRIRRLLENARAAMKADAL